MIDFRTQIYSVHCSEFRIQYRIDVFSSANAGNSPLNEALTAFVLEEILHQPGTIIGEDAADQFGSRVKRGSTRLGSAVAAFIIGCAKDDPTNLSPVQSTRTHATGFNRYVEGGFGQVFAAQRIESRREGDHLGMCGGIAEFFGHVVAAGNDLVVHHYNGPDGYFICFESLLGLAEGQPHEMLVVHRDGFV